MKRFLTVFISLVVLCFVSGHIALKAIAETHLRNYKPINLAKGSFLKGICQRDISSSTVKVGDVEYFINPADVFVGESNIIPKNSVYLGKIEEVIAPVEGVNASMKIKIYKVITPDKNEYLLDAYVYKNGSVRIGGELAQVAYYTKMPHYPGDWKRGALQLVPTSIREMGHPTVIRAGDEVTFIINNELNLYKPLN